MDESDPASEYNRRLVDCLADPYRCQLFVEILRGTCSRASELHTKYPNIPRATMYRHLKRLTEDGLIEVVDEVKKRGTVERTYAPVRRDKNIRMSKFNAVRTVGRHFPRSVTGGRGRTMV